MLFLTQWMKPAPRLKIEGARLYIRPSSKADAQDWVDLRTRNKEFLKPWSPSSGLLHLTPEGYARRLRGYRRDWAHDRGYAFLIFAKQDDKLLGGVTLNGIIRAAGQMANLGYWLDEAQAGQGYMTEAVKLACGFGFAHLGLHRIQAGTLPENIASQKVLQKSGFAYEGIARRYIKIANEWRDHHLYALLAEEFRDRFL